MNSDVLIGSVLVGVGIAVLLLRGRIPDLIHRGLRFFYGEPVADDAVRPNSQWHIAIVGGLMTILGLGLLLNTVFGSL